MSNPAAYGQQPARGSAEPGPGLPDLRWPVELLYWDTPQVSYARNRGALITNSPLAAGVFYGARAAGNAAARGRARQLAQPQWLVAGTGEVILGETGIVLNGTWGGTWASMRVDYSEVVSWDRDADALRIVPVDYYPLLLRTADPGTLAGWYAHLSHGKLWQQLSAETWQPAPQVRMAGWEQRDRRFACGIPAGWEPLTDRGYLSDAAKDAAGNRSRLLFMLRRNPAECSTTVDFNQVLDPELLSVLAADPGYLERDALRFAGVKAERGNGTVVSRPRVVLMDGERGTVIDTTATFPRIRVRLQEIYVARRGMAFMVGLAVAHPADPQRYFDLYAPEFHAMIATWKWFC